MGFLSGQSLCLLSLTLILFGCFGFLPSAEAASDYTSLVYKGCANQSFSDPSGVYSQALSALFGTLASQSSKAKFYKGSSGGGQAAFNGLFQCRGDLSNADCFNCVSKLPQMMSSMCGNAVSARVQLTGCYILYEISGFPQRSGYDMLYKMCSASEARGSGFEERRDAALQNLENGIASTSGFYTTSYYSVYVLAQCEGDLGTADCSECVKSAVQKAQVECGSSISGQMYLHKCYISYSYYPNGVPSKSSSGGSGSGSGQNPGKTIAIVVGAAAAVGFVIICLMFIRSLMKKHDDY
ncbi:PREDICTED: cysteine-rich repeat secretory protein 3 [Nelumbo nucifera]|uniref:Gnk2-homologous domain-containing protein n=2 Tax=Nelumbo nucifera TaxID=4432 RepID=A0A822XM78_NELNU|nr:PREDICTED: cysteine-rich repeat secretory protein 3 [Nelumbo nucifera]DAD20046.1 TPA_asm: hypothetical protein HUJ06_021509 [Nelumbo nucifera]